MTDSYRPWDIVVVPFPYSDSENEKRRPALIVSSEALYITHGMYWVAMITTARQTRMEGDVPIPGAATTGLLAASVIRPAKVTTIEHARILRRIGSVAAPEQKQLKAFFKQHLAA